jgi:predicted alpha/beta-hydrolase family hydrolase
MGSGGVPPNKTMTKRRKRCLGHRLTTAQRFHFHFRASRSYARRRGIEKQRAFSCVRSYAQTPNGHARRSFPANSLNEARLETARRPCCGSREACCYLEGDNQRPYGRRQPTEMAEEMLQLMERTLACLRANLAKLANWVPLLAGARRGAALSYSARQPSPVARERSSACHEVVAAPYRANGAKDGPARTPSRERWCGATAVVPQGVQPPAYTGCAPK